ncbi:SprT-like domain-containing protein [Geopsychrobacter electrodiphilus]|uniref:SprT-like domain-containing protein n=1 Tax=Geopsychrobacter electrodiphilus TaxID=225196 RepID=UPI0009FD030C|nr:SprT-like domain-containing protein [Geopsychrobacter electrodiphilus]
MLKCSTVGHLIELLDLTSSLKRQIQAEIGEDQTPTLLGQLWALPLKHSHAVTRLGSYACRGENPLAIRLQFAQEDTPLRQTFLHEIAHFLDHQTRQDRRSYHNPHGPSWQRWLTVIAGDTKNTESLAMRTLYAQKLKPVARCLKCGFLLYRLRSLPKGRHWLHRQCGGRLERLC